MGHRLPIRIAGMGAYVPDDVLTNQHFINYLDTNEEWIITRTGIRERRRAAANQATSTLAIEACKRAMADAKMTIDDIDAIVCATATGDVPFPATATWIQGELGGKGAPAFDVAGACAGFLYGSVTAAGLIQTGLYKNVLVVGAETLTRYVDPEDRGTVILMGDGAGAAVFTKSLNPEQQILYCELGCDGTRTKQIWIPAGGSQLLPSATTIAERLHYMRMQGREVYKFAVNKMMDLIDRALAASEITPDQLKMVIPHQSNLRIIESVREKLGLPVEKVAVNINRFGNTSAASIPLALDEARRDGRVKDGDLVLMLAVGAGLVWGVMVLRM